MDSISDQIRNQARAASVDAVRIAVMMQEGYSDREIKHHLDLDSAQWIVYRSWISNAIELQ